ncbi:MAG: FAD-binding oxidoreductase [Ktedonobacterales bacterium]
MGSVSWWQAEVADESGSHRDYPPLREAIEADVAIVGAGITGVGLALWLARAGIRVVVLEGREIAAGASGRNGGFLLGGTSETYSATCARYGREMAQRIWRLSVGNHTIAEGLVRELADSGWTCAYARNGSLRIAATEEELAEVQASAELLRADGWPVELVERDSLPERLQSAYLGASFHPSDGEIQPARFVHGLAGLAERNGARFYAQSPVTAVDRDNKGVTLHTFAGGRVQAPTLALATNAWLPQLGVMVGADWLARVITPTRGQMLVTAPVAERLFPCPCYADEGYQYWRQLADGRMAVGGWRNHSIETEYTGDETPGGAVQPLLDDFVHETLALPETQIERRWAGIMAFSTDGLPLVGALPDAPNMYIAGGYTGHGNAYALASAQIVAALIQGKSHPDADLFAPDRFAHSVNTGNTEGHP